MQTGLEEIKAGDKYPGWEKPFENSLMGIMDGEIQLLVSLPYPREIDIEDFKNLTAYGIYNEKYPLTIWRFGKNFLLPTPYNPEFEKQFKPNDVEKFICQKNRIMTRILIDQNGIIRVISLAELKSGFIEDLQKARGAKVRNSRLLVFMASEKEQFVVFRGINNGLRIFAF